jgi:hypothetical protein
MSTGRGIPVGDPESQGILASLSQCWGLVPLFLSYCSCRLFLIMVDQSSYFFIKYHIFCYDLLLLKEIEARLVILYILN